MNALLRRHALRWVAEARPAIVVEVLSSRGSVPRTAGTRMLVGAEACLGTVGGGHLELDAIALARRLLEGGGAPTQRHYPLGPALGQCCGGEVTLGFARLDASALDAWPALTPRFHLQLYGAGHVGRAIAKLLLTLECRVDWIDERDDLFAPAFALDAGEPERLADLRCVAVDAVEAEVAQAPPGAAFLVLTHSHDLDLRITEAVLRRSDFRFLGLIGSKTKRQRFAHHFERRGIPAATIARMVCPIGIEGVFGKEPEVIAVSAVAQLLRDAG